MIWDFNFVCCDLHSVDFFLSFGCICLDLSDDLSDDGSHCLSYFKWHRRLTVNGWSLALGQCQFGYCLVYPSSVPTKWPLFTRATKLTLRAVRDSWVSQMVLLKLLSSTATRHLTIIYISFYCVTVVYFTLFHRRSCPRQTKPKLMTQTDCERRLLVSFRQTTDPPSRRRT